MKYTRYSYLLLQFCLVPEAVKSFDTGGLHINASLGSHTLDLGKSQEEFIARCGKGFLGVDLDKSRHIHR